jgi:hypothetical protein
MAFRDHLIDACLADAHDGELGRDEESVRENERQDACQAPEDSRERLLHQTSKSTRRRTVFLRYAFLLEKKWALTKLSITV